MSSPNENSFPLVRVLYTLPNSDPLPKEVFTPMRASRRDANRNLPPSFWSSLDLRRGESISFGAGSDFLQTNRSGGAALRFHGSYTRESHSSNSLRELLFLWERGVVIKFD